MQFSVEKANDCARSALQKLAKSRSSADRLLLATAEKIGIEEVVAKLGEKGGAIHHHHQSVGRYLLTTDDLRRVIHSMRSEIEAKRGKAYRLTFAWSEGAPRFIEVPLSINLISF